MPSEADSKEPEAALAALEAHHASIDREADRLAQEHAERLQCKRGCSACCLDELTVVAVEAERIRRVHADLLEQAEPHPPGACAFLDAHGACRVYAERPSVCRSQGLPLRVLFEDEQEEIQERRDICELNLAGGPPLDSIADDACWLIGPAELRLAEIDRRFAGEDAPRARLRDLFSRAASPPD